MTIRPSFFLFKFGSYCFIFYICIKSKYNENKMLPNNLSHNLHTEYG